MKSVQLTLEADDGPTSTDDILLSLPSNDVANYDHRSTSISNEQSTVIDSLLITNTKFLSVVQPPPEGHNDNALTLIQQLLV